MKNISFLHLATNNQISMMASSTSHHPDVNYHYVNLARSPFTKVESFFKSNPNPDIILLMLPVTSEIAEMTRILGLSSKS